MRQIAALWVAVSMALLTIPEAVNAASEARQQNPSPTDRNGRQVENESSKYYRNCTEAKAAGAAPLRLGDPGYRAALDRDKDGIACE